jgi:hypothetical protein
MGTVLLLLFGIVLVFSHFTGALTPGYFTFRMERCKTLERFDGPGWLNGYLETV